MESLWRMQKSLRGNIEIDILPKSRNQKVEGGLRLDENGTGQFCQAKGDVYDKTDHASEAESNRLETGLRSTELTHFMCELADSGGKF